MTHLTVFKIYYTYKHASCVEKRCVEKLVASNTIEEAIIMFRKYCESLEGTVMVTGIHYQGPCLIDEKGLIK